MITQEPHLYIICSYLQREEHSKFLPFLSFRPNRIVIAKIAFPTVYVGTTTQEEVNQQRVDIFNHTLEKLNKLFTGLVVLKQVLTEQDIISNNKYLELLVKSNDDKDPNRKKS